MKHGYSSLWVLLAVALALLVVISLVEPVKLGGHEFKKATFIDELTKVDLSRSAIPWEIDSTGISTDSMSTDSVPASRFPVPVDTASKTILFFGDSMLEGLSPRLAGYCSANGHKLYTVIWYSSTTQVWGDCDTLSVFIRRYKPDYIIACLGANELFVKDIATKRADKLKHLLGEIGDRPLLWIGPPNWKEDTGINDLLANTLQEGGFFLSNGMTFNRKSDGAHPTRESASLWMDSVIRWMPAHCAHPIRMDSIPAGAGKPQRVTLLQPLK